MLPRMTFRNVWRSRTSRRQWIGYPSPITLALKLSSVVDGIGELGKNLLYFFIHPHDTLKLARIVSLFVVTFP